MTDLILLFVSTLGMVFFMGFQSLAVNSGNYWLAVTNSFIIGMFNLVLYKTAPGVQGPAEIACYIIGGPIGIALAMWVHRNVVPRIAVWNAHRKMSIKDLLMSRQRPGIKVWENGRGK